MTVETVLTDPQEKTKASFAERRDSLFEKIVATAHTWSEPDRLDAVARVFEHSAEDGRQLAARLAFTPKQYREVILGWTSFALKHPEIVFAFTKKYKELEQKGASSQNFDEHEFSTMMAALAWEGRFEPKRFVLEGDKAKARFLQEQIHQPVSIFPFSEIDDLYLDAFMQRRPIKVNEEIPEAERNRLSNGELMAERYLEGLEPLLEKRYYVGPIVDAFPQYAHEPIFHGSHVTEEKLREFFEKYHLPVETTLKRFASARIGTFREIDDVRRTVTSQELVKEIKKKLPEGFSLALDREARKYRVEMEEKKTEDEKWKSIENDENWEDEYEKNAMDQFEELLKQGADFGVVCSHLAGFDGIRAWKIRNRVEDEGAIGASTRLAESLAGIVSPRAQEMRERIRSKTGGLWKSWIGIDSPEAWKEREIAEAAGVSAPFLLRSIAGLDCPRAWEMRTRLQGQCTLEQMAQSIIGIDCPEAWKIRRAWRDEHNFGPMLISLGGLDTQEAWEMRDLVNIKAGSQLNENSLLLESLAGVDSPRARKMRNEIHWHPFSPEAMAHSLSGVFSSGINKYRMEFLQNEDRVESINGFAGIPGFLFFLFRPKVEEKRRKMEKVEKNENEEDPFEKMVLDEFEKALLKEGTTSLEEVTKRLGGLNSSRAWQIRNFYQTFSGRKGEVLLDSITGLDNEEAWKIRDQFGRLWPDFLLRSLAGLDSPRAWRCRKKFTEYDKDSVPVLLQSLKGVDSKEASAMRRGIEAWVLSQNEEDLTDDEYHASCLNLARSIIGLDSPDAWNLRESWHRRAGGNLDDVEYLLTSLDGLDSERAWKIRHEMKAMHGKSVDGKIALMLIESLRGLDSQEAWRMRYRFITEANRTSSWEITLQHLLLSLTGVNSFQATSLRETLSGELLSNSTNRSFLLSSFNGDDINGYAFLFRPKVEEKKNAALSESGAWQDDLDLLNLVTDPTLEGWREHQQKNQLSPEEALKRKREAAEHTQKYADRLVNDARSDRDASRELLATNPAIPDRAPERLAQLLLEQMLPEEAAKTRASFFDKFKSRFSSARRGRPEISSGFAPQQVYDGTGGGAEELADTRAVLEARQDMDDFLVSGAYGKYNSDSHQWEKVYFPVRRAHPEPAREVTLTCLNVKGLTHVQLPLPLDARLITERLRGLTKQDQEIPLEAVVDSLGAVTVEVPKTVVRIVYSLEQPAIPEPMADPSQKSFDAFVRNFERAHDGKDLRTMLAKLPHDVVAEVHSKAFQALSPKQRVQRIETLVRSLGWYDKHNEETREEKMGQAPNEQILICEERLGRLRERSNNPAMQHKRFAGVCADFALITCALLREAGMPAGVMRGLVMEGKVAQMRDHHATAFVPWPDDKGGIRLISVDGTPSEDSVASHVSRPTLVQLEAQSQEAITGQVAMAEETIQKIIQAAQAHDVETIRKLKNGKLEQALNVILQYEVKHSHLQAIERVFDVYWYGGLKHLDPIQDEIELRKAWEEEVEAQRQNPSVQEASGSAGTHLLEVVREFSARFRRSGFVKTQEDVFVVLDRIANLSSQNLSDVERRALVAVIEYLRAQKMK